MELETVEWFDNHFYKIVLPDGTIDYFPSVTTKLGIIAKPFLARWRGDITNREADMRVFEAQEKGIRIHNAAYVLANNGAVLYQPFRAPNFQPGQIEAITKEYDGNVAILNYQEEYYDVLKVNQWLEIVKPEIIYSERNVCSYDYRDAGTLDYLFYIKDGEYPVNGAKPLYIPEGFYVADLKTGNQVDGDAHMQTAAYAKCLEETEGIYVDGTIILHTNAKKKSGIEGLATLLRSREQMEVDYEDYRHAARLWERKNANLKPKVFEMPTMLTRRA